MSGPIERPVLLDWVFRLQSIAQSGLEFAEGVFDRQRYEEIQRLAAEMAAYPEDRVEAIQAVFKRAKGYATPKLICRAAVFDHADRVLMVREAADGRWTLPGGWIDVGEPPAPAAEREVREETGYEVAVTKLAAVYDKLRHEHPPAPHHSYLLFFMAELHGGSPSTSVETTEIGWFAADALPELSVGRATGKQILRMWDHHRDPGLPTDFDR